MRAEAGDASGIDGRRAGSQLVATEGSSFAAVDERRRGAQLGRQLPHRVSRYEGTAPGSIRAGRDRRSACRYEKLSPAGGTRASLQTFAAAATGRFAAISIGQIAGAV